MENHINISLTLPVLCAIGAATIAVLSGAVFLHNSAIDRVERQSDIISTSLRLELSNFKSELTKLDTDVVDVDEKVQEVDSSVAAADIQSDLVKEEVVEVMDEVVEVKEKVDDTADKLAVIKQALIVGFKDNEAVKLILTDERLSILLPEQLFSSEPQRAAALAAESSGIDLIDSHSKLSIAEFCEGQAGPIVQCYETYLNKAEQKLLISSIDD